MLLGLSELGEIVQLLPDLSRLPDIDELNPYELHISWQIVLKTTRSRGDIEDVLAFLMRDHDIHIDDISEHYRDGVDLRLADKKLGELLLDEQKNTQKALSTALGKQKRLGEILVEDRNIDGDRLREALNSQDSSRSAYRKTSIRIDVEKIDNLMNLAEEMGIGLARIQLLSRHSSRISKSR